MWGEIQSPPKSPRHARPEALRAKAVGRTNFREASPIEAFKQSQARAMSWAENEGQRWKTFLLLSD